MQQIVSHLLELSNYLKTNCVLPQGAQLLPGHVVSAITDRVWRDHTHGVTIASLCSLGQETDEYWISLSLFLKSFFLYRYSNHRLLLKISNREVHRSRNAESHSVMGIVKQFTKYELPVHWQQFSFAMKMNTTSAGASQEQK